MLLLRLGLDPAVVGAASPTRRDLGGPPSPPAPSGWRDVGSSPPSHSLSYPPAVPAPPFWGSPGIMDWC